MVVLAFGCAGCLAKAASRQARPRFEKHRAVRRRCCATHPQSVLIAISQIETDPTCKRAGGFPVSNWFWLSPSIAAGATLLRKCIATATGSVMLAYSTRHKTDQLQHDDRWPTVYTIGDRKKAHKATASGAHDSLDEQGPANLRTHACTHVRGTFLYSLKLS